jgi:hypothetical protein
MQALVVLELQLRALRTPCCGYPVRRAAARERDRGGQRAGTSFGGICGRQKRPSSAAGAWGAEPEVALARGSFTSLGCTGDEGLFPANPRASRVLCPCTVGHGAHEGFDDQWMSPGTCNAMALENLIPRVQKTACSYQRQHRTHNGAVGRMLSIKEHPNAARLWRGMCRNTRLAAG